LRANASKIRRTTAAFSAAGTAALPLVDQALDVPPLRLGEVEPLEHAARLCGVVVRDGRLEMLALRRGLTKLPAQPTEEAHRRLLAHRAD
jgi:hypothetical protein